MHYVGIDIAKSKHYATVLNAKQDVVVKPFGFTNDFAGFSLLLSRLEPLGKANLLIGLESTGHYGENLISFLFERGFKVCVINPVQTSAIRDSNIRQTKTDKVDTIVIARTLMNGNFRYFSYSNNDVQSLKHHCRFRAKLRKTITTNKQHLMNYLDLIFPEYQGFFASGIHIKTSYALLKRTSSPNQMLALRLPTLTKLLKQASRGHFGEETALQLRNLAMVSVGVKNDIIPLQITETITQIEFLQNQIKQAENRIAEIVDSLNSVIMTIPGMDYVTAGIILGEIGDIKRFSKPCKLLAFAGLDPAVKQSGKWMASSARMSKRGSSLLRYAFMTVSGNIIRYDATFSEYYTLKMSQGRKHYNALGHVAFKVVRLVHSLLTRNVAFVPQKAHNPSKQGQNIVAS